MAAGFWKDGIYEIPPIYVLSEIPRLTECLQTYALPGVEIESIKLLSKFSKNTKLTKKQLKKVQTAEIIVCDKLLLANIYNKLPDLKWAHCTCASLEELFETIPEKLHFLVTKHAGESFGAVIAEYVVCQILNHERGNKSYWKLQQAETGERMERFDTYRSLAELTVGIMGVGSIGTGIAKFLEPRGTTLIGFSQRPQTNNLFSSISTNLDDVLLHCDYLINTLPSTPATKGLLNNFKLLKCIEQPVFINVGRGDIISEDELVLALRDEWISAAVLDVFQEDPLPCSSQLWEMPQVTITPHIADVSKPEHIAKEFFNLVELFFSDDKMKSTVDWTDGY